MRVITVLEAYRKHIEERAALGIVPQPLNAEQTAGLIELLKNPPAGEEAFLVDLITNRVPPGVAQLRQFRRGTHLQPRRADPVRRPRVRRVARAVLLRLHQAPCRVDTDAFQRQL